MAARAYEFRPSREKIGKIYKMIATYMFGGYEMLKLFAANSKGNILQKQRILESVITKESIQTQKKMLESKQKIDIRDWFLKQREGS